MKIIKNTYLCFFVLIFFAGCSQPVLFRETRMLMDTFVEVSCLSPDRAVALSATKDAFKEIARIEKIFNKYDEKSIVSEINKLAGAKKVKVSPEVFNIIEDALYYSSLTEGKFDISIAPLADIWQDARTKNIIPDDKDIESARRSVGYKNIAMDRNDLSIYFLNKGTKIDLGGIVKGYAVDRAMEILRSHGINNAMVNIGGNISTIGNAPGRKGWRIGMRDPRDKKRIAYKIDLSGLAVSTSGDYERFFVAGGKRFSHIVDPSTGMPARGIISVSVVADSAEKADALSTAVFAVGLEKGLELLRSLDGVEAFIFDEDGKFIRYP